MENKNFEYAGWKINGFVALIAILAIIGGSIWLIVKGAMIDALPLTPVMIVSGALILTIALIACKGFLLLEPNEARVLTFFGKYCGSFYNTGFWWVNFLMSSKNISLRARNLNAEPIKVNDKTGNPIMIGLVLVWRLKRDEIYRSVFDIDVAANAQGIVSQSARMNMLENFVSVQSDAALRQVAGCYAYDNNSSGDEEVTLRSSSEEINELLEARLGERLAIAGIEVVEARINYLAYAPEIAAVMLRRQQADAIIAAREKIVEGAVSMVKMALERLSTDEVVELDDERKAAMVTNMLVVLCADESAQPVVNAGTMHH
ncbi:MAG: SPFH domain-containing protein [Alistipes sp.]|nr:SPFH domain-containing protein [Alistipes sp.]MBQ8778263.1 SPFH domain-containing protein [Alistipes sp.]MBR2332366.1 SPFH domain-containing protein [Alistipes sp.]MBR2399755.1 SPFH domain-containing protein [Alistipes sp.]MBR7097385.1 SPFH domain-containing protein [Alistipes sp.]